MRYEYAISIESAPCVIRHCPKCGARKPFLPSGLIRINAQKKLLDVWLIHRCQDCDQTWNLEVLARVSPGRLDPSYYGRLLANDAELARALAFDRPLHARKGAPLCLDTLRYSIQGERVSLCDLTGPAELILTCPVPLGVRLSRLIREILGLSARQFEAMAASGALSSPDGRELGKAKMGTRCTVRVSPP